MCGAGCEVLIFILKTAFFSHKVKLLVDTIQDSSTSYLALRRVDEPDLGKYLGVAGSGEDELLRRLDDEHLLPPGHTGGGHGGQTGDSERKGQSIRQPKVLIKDYISFTQYGYE